MAKIKITSSLDVENIWVTVRCPECGHDYAVQMQGATRSKNCRCGDVVFKFYLAPEPGALVITATVQVGYNEPEAYFIKKEAVEVVEE